MVVVSKFPRDNGMTEVTLSQDGDRFVMHIPTWMADDENTEELLQRMVNIKAQELERLRSIVDRNRGV